MREDLADEAEIHAFRGASGSVSWLAGQTRPDVSCQVSQLQQTLSQPTSFRIKHGGSQSSSASRFGSQDQASSRAKHDVVVAC